MKTRWALNCLLYAVGVALGDNVIRGMSFRITVILSMTHTVSKKTQRTVSIITV